jgi:hypothetical protein
MGAENDYEGDAGRGDRDAVDIAAPAIWKRMAQLPSLCRQGAQGPANRVLRACPDTAAACQADPTPGIDQQRDHDHDQGCRHLGGATGRGDEGERTGRQPRRATRGRSAQTPMLLTTRKAASGHGEKLASASDGRWPIDPHRHDTRYPATRRFDSTRLWAWPPNA